MKYYVVSAPVDTKKLTAEALRDALFANDTFMAFTTKEDAVACALDGQNKKASEQYAIYEVTCNGTRGRHGMVYQMESGDPIHYFEVTHADAKDLTFTVAHLDHVDAKKFKNALDVAAFDEADVDAEEENEVEADAEEENEVEAEADVDVDAEEENEVEAEAEADVDAEEENEVDQDVDAEEENEVDADEDNEAEEENEAEVDADADADADEENEEEAEVAPKAPKADKAAQAKAKAEKEAADKAAADKAKADKAAADKLKAEKAAAEKAKADAEKAKVAAEKAKTDAEKATAALEKAQASTNKAVIAKAKAAVEKANADLEKANAAAKAANDKVKELTKSEPSFFSSTTFKYTAGVTAAIAATSAALFYGNVVPTILATLAKSAAIAPYAAAFAAKVGVAGVAIASGAVAVGAAIAIAYTSYKAFNFVKSYFVSNKTAKEAYAAKLEADLKQVKDLEAKLDPKKDKSFVDALDKLLSKAPEAKFKADGSEAARQPKVNKEMVAAFEIEKLAKVVDLKGAARAKAEKEVLAEATKKFGIKV